MLRRTFSLATLTALAALAAACGKETFLAAAFVQTPPLPNPLAPGNNLPAFALMTAYLGTIDTTNPTKIDASSVAGLAGADASVSFHSLQQNKDLIVPVKDQGSGTYLKSSADDAHLTFETNVPYTLVLIAPSGEAFGARLTPGPQPLINEFHTTAGQVLHQAASADFTITRGEPPEADGTVLPGFVVVGQIDPNNPSASPKVTYTTVPQEPKELLKLVLSDQPFRKTSFTVPAKAFVSQTGTGCTAGPLTSCYFVVTLLAVRQGKVSENAFIGSTALAGSGDAGLIVIP